MTAPLAYLATLLVTIAVGDGDTLVDQDCRGDIVYVTECNSSVAFTGTVTIAAAP